MHTKPASSRADRLVVPQMSQQCKTTLPHSRRRSIPCSGGDVELSAHKSLHERLAMSYEVGRKGSSGHVRCERHAHQAGQQSCRSTGGASDESTVQDDGVALTCLSVLCSFRRQGKSRPDLLSECMVWIIYMWCKTTVEFFTVGSLPTAPERSGAAF